MKKYILKFLLVLIFSAFVVSNNVKAQNPLPPCPMDCFEIGWQFETYTIQWHEFFTFCPDLPMGCGLTIEFWHRYADCPPDINAYDVQIKSIYLHESCLTPCINSKSVDQIYNFALKNLYDWMVLHYNINDNQFIFRAVNISCWFRGLENNIEIIKYCPDVHPRCCWKKYSINKTGLPKYNLIDAYQPFQWYQECSVAPWPCMYICDKDSLFDPPPDILKTINDFNNNKIIIDNSFESLLNKISENNDYETIEFYDILGRLNYRIVLYNPNFINELQAIDSKFYYYFIKSKQFNVYRYGVYQRK